LANLNFKGKSIIQNHHFSVKYHQLLPQNELSLTGNVSLNDNIIIHGDNLKALKALLPNYEGEIDCIYIDPPYNTGEEKWVFNDNVNSPMIQEWLGTVVDKEDLARHDKWSCMMMPRLKLLWELLSEDGVIFISIDYNEVHHLTCLMNEIFGENNYSKIYVLETKGLHLSDNPDTEYKKNIFKLCNELCQKTSWETIRNEFEGRTVVFELLNEEEWQRKLNKLLCY